MRKAIYALLAVALMFLAYVGGRRHTSFRPGAASNPRQVLYYVDPMHPAYKSDKPGIAPDCGMKLEPVYADEHDSASSARAGIIQIDAYKQQLIGIHVAPVEASSSGAHEVHLTGRVAVDESRVYRVNAGVDGWVQQTFGDSVGIQVKKNQQLATFYSRELWAAQQSFLAGTLGSYPSKEPSQGGVAVADRLRNLGVSEEQIKELSERRQSSSTVSITSPADGFIEMRNISPGEKFEPGAEFYRIVDLSKVWIVAEVFENDTQFYRPGMLATLTLPQGKKLHARVGDALPLIDPATHTFKLRLDADNPGFALRPDMFVDVTFSVRLPAGLSIPSDALIDTGSTKHVFVESGPGIFEYRVVETGWHYGDRIQVVRGLRAGDRVVSEGTFLVDSENKIEASAAGRTATPEAEPTDAPAKSQKETAQELKRAKAPALAVHDPKCGMDVDPSKAASEGHVLTHHGRVYYFCSNECKEEFRKNPEKYLGSSQEMAGVRR
jgi:membrane fusion protein, copper/silver efflux system